MTGPEQAPSPSVSTAPAEGAAPSTASPRTPLGRRRLPAHLGAARTSTVLLALAFVAIGVLYLFVRPPDPARTAGVPDPAPTTSRSIAPTTSAPPATTTRAPEESEPPASGTGPTTTEAPDEGTVEDTATETPTSPDSTSTAGPTTSEVPLTTTGPS